MQLAIGVVFLGIAAWMTWVPWSEYRHAAQTEQPRLTFSRMLLRIAAAFCILAIGVMILAGPYVLPGRTVLFEVLYLLAALVLALMMLVAGFTEYLFVKRDLLLEQRRLIREIAGRKAASDESGAGGGTGNGTASRLTRPASGEE